MSKNVKKCSVSLNYVIDGCLSTLDHIFSECNVFKKGKLGNGQQEIIRMQLENAGFEIIAIGIKYCTVALNRMLNKILIPKQM